MKLPRRTFLRLAAGAAALPALSRIAQAQSYPTRPVLPIIVGFPGGGAAMSPFSQQLMYRGREHETLPLLLPFSHGDSEVRGERYESRLEPSPRTRGYATLRPTSCLCPARRPANCQRAKAVRQQHGCLAASTFSLLDLRAPTPQSAQAAADAAPHWHHLGWKSPPCSQARLERPI